MPQIYHYTDREGLEGIIRSGKIVAQVPHGGESRMPYGVYLTELPPRTSLKKLVINNYDDFRRVLDDQELKSKLEFWIMFDTNDFPEAVQRDTNRNEWIIARDIDVNECLSYGRRAGKLNLCY